MNTQIPDHSGTLTKPSVLLVIPTLNEAANIAAVIATLTADFDFNGQSKIIVVDGGSTDRTKDIVRALIGTNVNIFLQHNPLRIQSAAVNLAVREFGGDIDVLIRCDAHAHYPPDFVSRLLLTLEQTGSDAIVVPMDSVGTECTSRAIAWLADSLVGSGGSAHRGGRSSGYVDHGHHAAFRLETFRIIGGYDESFRCNEDAELDARQRAIGAKIYLDGANRIMYQPRPVCIGSTSVTASGAHAPCASILILRAYGNSPFPLTPCYVCCACCLLPGRPLCWSCPRHIF